MTDDAALIADLGVVAARIRGWLAHPRTRELMAGAQAGTLTPADQPDLDAMLETLKVIQLLGAHVKVLLATDDAGGVHRLMGSMPVARA